MTMKKTYAILLVISLLAVYQTRAQYVVGPSVVCSGETATYTVYGPGCMVQIDGPDGLNYGTYNPGPGYWNFTINWTNTGTTNVTDNFRIYISAMYWDPNTGNHTGCPPYFEIPLSVTVKPNITSVARPSTPTVKYISGKLYEFETNSSNATNYQWVVTGGTIQGSSTGKKIRVIRSSSSCTLTARARGYSQGCNGNVYSSYSSTRSYTVPEPSLAGIAGNTYLYPYATISYTPFFSSSSSEQGSVTSWTLSDPGGKLSMNPYFGNTATVSMGAPTSTLHFATLYCTVSNGCHTKTMTATLMYGGSSSRVGEEEVRNNELDDDAGLLESSDLWVYPNPSNQGENIMLKRLLETEVDEYLIFAASGRTVHQGKIPMAQGTLSISTEELPGGIYFLKFLNKGELVATRKLVIK